MLYALKYAVNKAFEIFPVTFRPFGKNRGVASDNNIITLFDFENSLNLVSLNWLKTCFSYRSLSVLL